MGLVIGFLLGVGVMIGIVFFVVKVLSNWNGSIL